jgi:tetratricopeptide (TPR) repeat protein
MTNISKFEYLKKEFKKIDNLFRLNKFLSVIEKSKKILKKYPEQTPFYNLIGISYKKIGKFLLAEEILKNGLKIKPNDENLLINLGSTYRGMIQYKKSEKYLKQALKINENNINALINYANLKRDMNEIYEATKLYEKAQALGVKGTIININLAGIYQIDGDFKKSRKLLEEELKKNPSNVIAHKLLSNVIKYGKNNSHQLEMLSTLDNNPLSKYDEATISFAISKSYEDQKDYKKSFHYFKRANDIQKEIKKNYSINSEINLFNKIKKVFQDTNFNKFPANNYTSKKIIFIVGLPRSGTTLAHQIIASHSKVHGAGEVVIFDQFMYQKIKDDKFNAIFKDYISQNENILESIVKNYFLSIDFIKTSKSIIIDKHPLNFQWLGFIKILFPNSKIVHCTRNLKDTALSIYKNAFDINSIIWGNDQSDLVKYISLYLDLMKFWKEKIPNDIYDLDYEKLIENQNNEIKKLIKFCELDWEESCLNFSKKSTPIKTVSITQAREAIYKTSVKSFEKFNDYLSMFKKIDDLN